MAMPEQRLWANVDLESTSTIDLTVVGGHVYAAHYTTKILCMAYKVCGGQTRIWWPGEPFPADLAYVIENGGIIEAWNAAFERVMWPLMELLGSPRIKLEQWRCTMVRAFLQGFPGKLEHAGPSMGLGVCKDTEGHKIMMQLCKPRQRWQQGKKGYDKARAMADGDEYQVLQDGEVVRWWRDPEKLERLGRYCMVDTDTEAAASAFLDVMPEREVRGWQLDQRINDRGFFVDVELVHKALELVKPATLKANERLSKLSNGELKSITKPNEIRAWLNARLGLSLDSIGKDVLNDLLVTMEDQLPKDVKAVIELRLAAAKTSTAKLRSLLRGINKDTRFRGGLQYAGAGRTNRWAGRRFQPQNLPRPPEWAIFAIEWVLEQSIEDIELAFGSALEAISAILRSCIEAEPQNELHFADYNAIEARITAWYCGAMTILDAYRTGKDPYRMQAARVFGIADWTTIGKASFERFLGKQLLLGCGFGMGAPKFQDSCKKLGKYVDLPLAQKAIDTYRNDNPEIPAAWRELDAAAACAIRNPDRWIPALGGKIHFYRDAKFMRVRLPSGRFLSYLSPQLVDDVTPWGAPTQRFQFWGWNGERQRMEWQTMYGGRWMENIAQATARDVMLDSMLRLDAEGWHIILTVHDEEGCEEPKGERHIDHMISTMATPPEWAPDLPLAVEGWTGKRYRK